MISVILISYKKRPYTNKKMMEDSEYQSPNESMDSESVKGKTFYNQ